MKYCPFCGAPRETVQSQFCMKCGSRFPTPAVENASLIPNNPGNKRLMIIDAVLGLIILALAVLLAAGAFAV